MLSLMLDGHLRRPLLAASIVLFVADFLAFLFLERPGLGIGHGFYVAIACAALATNMWGGAAAGLLATTLYGLGVYLSPRVPVAELPTLATAIRLVTYVLVGMLIGYYAARSQALLRRAHELADELRVLSRRDFITGLPNQRAFEIAINRRLDLGEPFALVVCDLAQARPGMATTDELLTYAERVTAAVDPSADVARVTDGQLAVLVAVADDHQAAVLTSRVERALGGNRPSTGGWANFPRDGRDALGLYTAASERLYARRIAKGELQEPTPLDAVTL